MDETRNTLFECLMREAEESRDSNVLKLQIGGVGVIGFDKVKETLAEKLNKERFGDIVEQDSESSENQLTQEELKIVKRRVGREFQTFIKRQNNKKLIV